MTATAPETWSPFYLPRELTVVILTAVYIPPDANVSSALAHLHQNISKQHKIHPDGVHVIAGDFNQACLKSVLPKFTQYANCATGGNNTLNHVYSKACLQDNAPPPTRALRPPLCAPPPCLHSSSEDSKALHQNHHNVARGCTVTTPGLLLKH